MLTVEAKRMIPGETTAKLPDINVFQQRKSIL